MKHDHWSISSPQVCAQAMPWSLSRQFKQVGDLPRFSRSGRGGEIRRIVEQELQNQDDPEIQSISASFELLLGIEAVNTLLLPHNRQNSSPARQEQEYGVTIILLPLPSFFLQLALMPYFPR